MTNSGMYPLEVRYVDLYDTYIGLSVGSEQPDEIRAGADAYQAVRDWYDPSLQEPWRERSQLRPRGLQFMGAEVMLDPTIPNDQLWYRNTRHPDDPAYNAVLQLERHGHAA